MSAFDDRRILTWLVLGGICAAYVFGVWALDPTSLFGLTHDDMLYFTSAKALAEHRGYIAPSVPGTPPATKYPVLYPWLLSWVWRGNPSFPENLSAAIWLNVIFGLVVILASYRLLRDTQGLSNAEALILTGYCALHPLMLFYSGTVMAEIPFAAFALTGLILANRAMRRGAAMGWPLGCAVIFGLAVLIRTAGVPLFGGVLLAGVLRRAWRQVLAYAAGFAPFFLGLFWRSILSVPAAPYGAYSSSAPGWKQAWLYYTDYVAFRKMASPNFHVLLQLALNQVIYLTSNIAGFFLAPLSEKSLVFWFVTTVMVFSAVCVGWSRHAKYSGWAPVHLAAALYILSLLSWDYPDWQRFLLLFLPLIAAGLWVQGKNWTLELANFARNARGAVEKFAALSALGMFLLISVAAVWNYALSGRARSISVSQKRQILLREKQEAYRWLRENLASDVHVIATEDGCVYLYAGLQSMVPIVPSPGGIYDANLLKADLDHMMDVAQSIDAKYWVVSADDYGNTQAFFKPFLDSRTRELAAVLPAVFQSSDKHIAIYDLTCVHEPEASACRNARLVLFPDGVPTHEAQTTESEAHQ